MNKMKVLQFIWCIYLSLMLNACLDGNKRKDISEVESVKSQKQQIKPEKNFLINEKREEKVIEQHHDAKNSGQVYNSINPDVSIIEEIDGWSILPKIEECPNGHKNLRNITRQVSYPCTSRPPDMVLKCTICEYELHYGFEYNSFHWVIDTYNINYVKKNQDSLVKSLLLPLLKNQNVHFYQNITDGKVNHNSFRCTITDNSFEIIKLELEKCLLEKNISYKFFKSRDRIEYFAKFDKNLKILLIDQINHTYLYVGYSSDIN